MRSREAGSIAGDRSRPGGRSVAAWDALRRGTFIDATSLRVVGAVVVLSSAIMLYRLRPASHPDVARVGFDFFHFWTISRALLDGQAGILYSPEAFHALQRELFGASRGWAPVLYPPHAWLLFLPLAGLPPLGAMVVAHLLGIAALVAVLRAMRVPPALLALCPAGYWVVAHGHPTYLLAALFAAAFALLPRHPVAAGVLLGVASAKPHLGLLIPVALIAGRRWRAAAAMALTVAAMVATSAAAFGVEAWRGFAASRQLAWSIVSVVLPPEKIHSVFGAARLLGAPVPLAAAAHALGVAVASLLIVRVWRGRASDDAKAAVVLSGTLLASPYLYDFDLLVGAVAAAFIFRRAAGRWLVWEKLALTLVLLAPFFTTRIAAATRLQLGVVASTVLFGLAVRRAGLDSAGERPGAPAE